MNPNSLKTIDNKEDFEIDTTKYFKCLNTFEGLTNIEKC